MYTAMSAGQAAWFRCCDGPLTVTVSYVKGAARLCAAHVPDCTKSMLCSDRGGNGSIDLRFPFLSCSKYARLMRQRAKSCVAHVV